jgi:hypothetical protein
MELFHLPVVLVSTAHPDPRTFAVFHDFSLLALLEAEKDRDAVRVEHSFGDLIVR